MAAARRTYKSAQVEPEGTAPRRARNPYMLIAVMVGLIGMALVIVALIFYIRKRDERARRLKLIRGITLLDRLDDVAADYFYNDRKNRLPKEAWAPFVAEAEKHKDLVDAVITRSRGAIDDFVDAARYKKGMKWRMNGPGRFYGEPRDGRYPESGKVQVVEGHVIIDHRSARVLFFRRPIIDPKGEGWFGKATIILLRDAPSPEPPPGAGLEVNALPEPEKKKDDAPKPAEKPASK